MTPANWVDSLQGWDKNKHLFLLFRHSEREQIPSEELGRQVALTGEGRKLARQLGQRIKRPISSIVSSPVARCLETSKEIKNSRNSDLPILISHLLAEPGAFVLSCEAAGHLMYECNGLKMVNLLLGGYPTPGLRGVREGCEMLLGLLKTLPAAAGHVTLLVSHDSVLAPFIFGLLQRNSIDPEDWPGYLEGCGIYFEMGSIRLHWRGEVHEVSLSNSDWKAEL
jgi:hypothetical protein